MTNVGQMTTSDDPSRVLFHMRIAMERMKEDRGLMSFSLGMVFLAVAEKQGLQVKEYAEMTGLLPSYVSRNLATLGAKERNGSDGLGLVELKAADATAKDTRSKSVWLTPKGEALAAQVVSTLQPKKKDMH